MEMTGKSASPLLTCWPGCKFAVMEVRVSYFTEAGLSQINKQMSGERRRFLKFTTCVIQLSGFTMEAIIEIMHEEK